VSWFISRLSDHMRQSTIDTQSKQCYASLRIPASPWWAILVGIQMFLLWPWFPNHSAHVLVFFFSDDRKLKAEDEKAIKWIFISHFSKRNRKYHTQSTFFLSVRISYFERESLKKITFVIFNNLFFFRKS